MNIKVFNFVGNYSLLMIVPYSMYLLRNKNTLFIYYTVGLFFCIMLNLLIKGIVQQPRPSEDAKLFHLALQNYKDFIFKDGIPFNIFGMPSGHSQLALYSTIFVYLSTKNVSILFIYGLLSFIIMTQRVYFNYHTMSQVIVGALVGALFGYTVYFLSQQHLKGLIREKTDDFAIF